MNSMEGEKMSDEEVREILEVMEDDPSYTTVTAYRANAEIWPNHRISFVDTHLAYLKAHPNLKPEHYLANLRLMIKKR